MAYDITKVLQAIIFLLISRGGRRVAEWRLRVVDMWITLSFIYKLFSLILRLAIN